MSAAVASFPSGALPRRHPCSNRHRRAQQLWRHPQVDLLAARDCYAFARGATIVVVTNVGAGGGARCEFELPADGPLPAEGRLANIFEPQVGGMHCVGMREVCASCCFLFAVGISRVGSVATHYCCPGCEVCRLCISGGVFQHTRTCCVHVHVTHVRQRCVHLGTRTRMVPPSLRSAAMLWLPIHMPAGP